MKRADDDVLGATQDRPSSMTVVSTTEHPIVISNSHCRFVLRNEGTLSKDSVMSFQLLVSDANSGHAFLPCNTGIFALLKECTLSIGGVRLHNLQDIAYFRGMTQSYETPSYRTNRSRILRGVNNVMMAAPTAPVGNTNAGTYIPAGSVATSETSAELDYQMKLTSSASSSPEWSLALKDIFPILQQIELPLYLLTDQVVLDFRLQSQLNLDQDVNGVGSLCCFENSAANTQRLGACELNLANCLLYQDTIYWNNEKVEAISKSVNARDGFFLNYTDVLHNVSNHPAADPITIAGETTTINLQKNDRVAVSGHSIKNLFWGFAVADWRPSTVPPSAIGTPGNNQQRYWDQWLGKYALLAYRKSATFDVRLNDQLLLPEPMSSETQKFTECTNVYDSPPWLNQSLYSYNPSVTKGDIYPNNARAQQLPDDTYGLWGGHQSAASLNAKQHFCALHLGNLRGDSEDDSTLVSSKPIEVLHSELPVTAASNYNRRCLYYAEIVRRFGVQDGSAIVFEGPAVIAN